MSDSPMTKEESDALRAQWDDYGERSGYQIWSVTGYDVAQCPIHSFWPPHFRRDGSCRCDELPAALAELAEVSKRYLHQGRSIRCDYYAALIRVQACGGDPDDQPTE